MYFLQAFNQVFIAVQQIQPLPACGTVEQMDFTPYIFPEWHFMIAEQIQFTVREMFHLSTFFHQYFDLFPQLFQTSGFGFVNILYRNLQKIRHFAYRTLLQCHQLKRLECDFLYRIP